MHDSNPVCTPIAPHFKLSSAQFPTKDEDLNYMSKVPYSSVIGSLMYAMVSHPVSEGKPNANHVRARIRNSRTQ
jgi:hypothetical protein